MNEIEDDFGLRLKAERTRLGFTQQSLAELTNVSVLSIGQYENGRSVPSIKFIYAINLLKLDVVYILLAIRKESSIQKYSLEICKRVAKEIELLESKLGENLDHEARISLTLSLLNYFNSNPQYLNENISTSLLLSKIL